MVLSFNLVYSEFFSFKYIVSDNYFFIGFVQVYFVYFFGFDVCKVYFVFFVVKVKVYYIVKVLGYTSVVFVVRGQFSDVVFVGEY